MCHFWVVAPPKALLHHLRTFDCNALQKLRAVVVPVAANVWKRLELPCQGFPLRLAVLVSPLASQEEKAAVAAELDAARQCCVDRGMTARLLGP